MKKAAAALAGITLALAPWGGAAANESPVRFAPGGVGNAHPHHVHTGNGGCVNINSEPPWDCRRVVSGDSGFTVVLG